MEQYTQLASMYIGDSGDWSQPSPRLYIFNPQLQLLAVLSVDGGIPFYDAVHKEQLFNADTAAQTQVENSLTFYIPAAPQTAAQFVVEGNYVAFQDLDGACQLFEIVLVDDYHDDTLYKQVYAVNAGQSELADEWIDSLSLSSADAQSALSATLSGTRWQIGQVSVSGNLSATIERANVLQALQTLVKTLGGDLQFRVTVGGNTVTGMYVDWLDRRGRETGKRFVYSKDVASVQRTVDLTSLKTALYGYGKQNDDGTYVTFRDVVWSKANGDPVDKPAGQDWVGDPNALAQWGRAGGTRHRFGVFTDGNQADPSALLQETWQALQSASQPLVSYQMSVVDLEQIAGYAHEAVRLGDTVAVIDTEFSPELRITAQVIEIDRDLINPQNTQIVLGNFLPITASVMKQVSDLQGQVNSIQSSAVQVTDKIPTSKLEGVIDALQNEVQSSQGYVYLTSDEGLLILDAPKDQNPTKAIQLKGGIIAIANSKDANGNWQWRTFGTGDGFTADLIKTGTLQGVSITLGGSGNGNGQFTLEDSSGNTFITMDNNGIKLSNGATMMGGSGVLSTLVFVSQGYDFGWQRAGWWDEGGVTINDIAYLFGYIPPNFAVTAATLYTKIMPVNWTQVDGGSGWTTVSQARLKFGLDPTGYYYYPYASEPSLGLSGLSDVSSAVWGGYWSPNSSTHTIQTKSADVTNLLSAGHRFVFSVDSANSSPSSGYGLVQLELVVTGYKNG